MRILETKNAFVILAVVLALTAVPAFAEDGVSASALKALGLGEMEILSDSQGTEVRGMSGANAFAAGASLTVGH